MSVLTIENRQISVSVDTLGAQMMSLQGVDGLQYLWQGDPAVWKDRSLLLFPFVARLTENSYLYKGKQYSMGIHGFAKDMEFAVVDHTDDCLHLVLTDSAETRKQYPFAFCLHVIYTLEDKGVRICYRVENRSDEDMFFGIGGHPGFRVPLFENEAFTDYVLAFNCACRPDRLGFSEDLYLNGQDKPYPFVEGKYLHLRHDLFDEDAIVLKNTARSISLYSGNSGRGVRLDYPGMPYLGIWHMPKTQAQYVCVEPWSSLPSRQGVVDEFTCKSDLIRLEAGKVWQTEWSITLF